MSAGPSIIRAIPASVLHHAATALTIAQARIDVLEAEVKERGEIIAALHVALDDRDAKISELQAMVGRAYADTERP